MGWQRAIGAGSVGRGDRKSGLADGEGAVGVDDVIVSSKVWVPVATGTIG